MWNCVLKINVNKRGLSVTSFHSTNSNFNLFFIQKFCDCCCCFLSSSFSFVPSFPHVCHSYCSCWILSVVHYCSMLVSSIFFFLSFCFAFYFILSHRKMVYCLCDLDTNYIEIFLLKSAIKMIFFINILFACRRIRRKFFVCLLDLCIL